jgi:hypothetical protein
MKYYCENCGSEWAITNKEEALKFIRYQTCPFCLDGAGKMMEVPAHETVAQWEERCKEDYPDTAPVYVRDVTRSYPFGHWICMAYEDVVDDGCVVVATEAGAPPDDWHPLDCGKCSKAAEEQVCSVCDKQ